MKKEERQARILKHINAVRTRPNMYVGSTDSSDHIIHECLDNALDELRNGHGNTVGINFSKKHEVLIFDNGRGLPGGETLDEETGIMCDTITSLFTKTHSGTKFELGADTSLFGQNGVGLLAVNALSDYVDVKTKTEHGIFHYRFEDSELVTKEKINDIEWSTELIFKPNKSRFKSIVPTYQSFSERLYLAQAKIPNSKFIFCGKEIKKLNFEEFISNKLKIGKKTPLFKCEFKTNRMPVQETDGKSLTPKTVYRPANILLFLTYEPGDTIIEGDVNLRFCEGTYLTNLQSLIKSILPGKLNKKFQNAPDRFLIEGLRLYASLQIPLPRFDSQTKTRMILDVKNDLILPLESKLNKILSEKYIITTVETILNQKMGNMSKLTKSKKISSDNKLNDCTNKPGEILYIIEGDSAASAVRDCRHAATEAYLPLRGKVINVEKQSLAKIKENKEIKNIIEAVGAPPYRYEKVKILADADLDGAHINVLVILIFFKYFKELIDEGRLSVILPPLYGANKKDKFIPIYNLDDVEKYKQKNYDIQRFKGLGEMSAEFMRQILDNEIEYVIQPPENEKLLNHLIKIITSPEEKRKYLEKTEEYNLNKFISEIFTNLKHKGK